MNYPNFAQQVIDRGISKNMPADFARRVLPLTVEQAEARGMLALVVVVALWASIALAAVAQVA